MFCQRCENDSPSVTVDHAPNVDVFSSRFSSYTLMLRVISYIFKFISNNRLSKAGLTRVCSALSADKIRVTELKLLRLIQSQYFGDVVERDLFHQLLLNN